MVAATTYPPSDVKSNDGEMMSAFLPVMVWACILPLASVLMMYRPSCCEDGYGYCAAMMKPPLLNCLTEYPPPSMFPRSELPKVLFQSCVPSWSVFIKSILFVLSCFTDPAKTYPPSLVCRTLYPLEEVPIS